MTIYDNNSKKITRTVTKYVYDGKAFNVKTCEIEPITLISEAKYLTETTAVTVEEKRAYSKALASFSTDDLRVVRIDLNSVDSGLYECTVAQFMSIAKFVKKVEKPDDENADENADETVE